MSEELQRGIPKAICIGYREISPEERAEGRKFIEEMMRDNGILKEGEHLTEENDVHFDKFGKRIKNDIEKKDHQS